jgi:hypothetical protein
MEHRRGRQDEREGKEKFVAMELDHHSDNLVEEVFLDRFVEERVWPRHVGDIRMPPLLSSTIEPESPLARGGE